MRKYCIHLRVTNVFWHECRWRRCISVGLGPVRVEMRLVRLHEPVGRRWTSSGGDAMALSDWQQHGSASRCHHCTCVMCIVFPHTWIAWNRLKRIDIFRKLTIAKLLALIETTCGAFQSICCSSEKATYIFTYARATFLSRTYSNYNFSMCMSEKLQARTWHNYGSPVIFTMIVYLQSFAKNGNKG